MTRLQSLTELVATLIELGDDEVETVAWLAARLLHGQKQYGRLSLKSEGRDWKLERKEEIEDLLIYSAFQALKR
jgi:hypothetical protein